MDDLDWDGNPIPSSSSIFESWDGPIVQTEGW